MHQYRKYLEQYERQTGKRVSASLWAHYVRENPLTNRLSSGRHRAPYLDLEGRPLVLDCVRGGVLVDVTPASSAIPLPAIEQLLPRGVHGSPWFDQRGPVLLVIDSSHRLVAWQQQGGALVEQVRDLLEILEAHESTMAEAAPATEERMIGEADSDDDLAGEEWKRGR